MGTVGIFCRLVCVAHGETEKKDFGGHKKTGEEKMEIAALVCGIVSVVGCWIPSMGWIGSICGVVAIVLGAISIKKNLPKKKLGKIGMILGIIGLALGIIMTIVAVACVAAVGKGMMDVLNSLQ